MEERMGEVRGASMALLDALPSQHLDVLTS